MVAQFVTTEAQNRFAIPATDQVRLIGDAFSRYLGEVESLGAFYDASEFVDRNEFSTFTRSVISQFPGLQALEWVPRVPGSEREEFLARALADGFARFEISERAKDGSLVRAGEREAYFPVYYVEPLAGNEAAIGFDLASNSARRSALDTACDQGAMTLTQRITLVQETGSQAGVLAVLPVYEGGVVPTTLESRRNSLRGYVLGVLRIGEVLKLVLDPIEGDNRFDVSLFDLGAEPDKSLLHFEALNHAAHQTASTLDDHLSSDHHVSSSFRMADRTWAVVLRPHDNLIGLFEVLAPLGAAAFLIFLTGVLALFVFNVRTRASDIALRVQERTLALQQSESQMRLIADSVPANITFFDTERVFRFVNDGALTGYGKPRESVVNHPVQEVLEVPAYEKLSPNIERALAGERVTFEETINYPDGGSRDVTGEYIPHVDDRGVLEGAFALVLDISERKQVEESLREANEVADAARRAKSEFLANMSHEIRTPLNAVIGLSELMLKTKLSNRQRQFVSNIQSSGQNLLELIGDVLDFSKIEAGQLELEMTRFEIADVMEGIGNFALITGAEPDSPCQWEKSLTAAVLQTKLLAEAKAAG